MSIETKLRDRATTERSKRTAKRKPHRIFLAYEDFAPLFRQSGLPHIPQEAVQYWGVTGAFPRPFKLSKRALPLYPASEICEWAYVRFSRQFPDEVEVFVKAVRAIKRSSTISFSRSKTNDC